MPAAAEIADPLRSGSERRLKRMMEKTWRSQFMGRKSRK
jgi:hypothetical protein